MRTDITLRHSQSSIVTNLFRVFNSSHNHLKFSRHVIVTTLLLLLQMTSQTFAQVWEEPPEARTQPLGAATQFTCGLSNLNGSSIAWSQFHANGTLVESLFVDDSRWTDNTRYTVQRHSSASGVDGYDLLIADIERFDDKVYRCTVQKLADHRQAALTVLGKGGVLLFCLLT